MVDLGGVKITEAKDGDIPEIVALLKLSLGESLMPKSDDYWRWKHVDNPFGPSPVLLARMDGKIVGVRAFMRWTWVSSHKRVSAVRAVDTATHPEYQGKGIFNKLTMALLEKCRRNSFDIVYNTPNSKSLPGYLKMGWSKVGKYPLRIRIVRPVSIIQSLFMQKEVDIEEADDTSVTDYLNHPGMSRLLSAHYDHYENSMISAHTLDSLIWRYARVPVVKYHAAGIETGGVLKAVLFYRIKGSRIGTELRVTDLFAESGIDIGQIRNLLRDKTKLHGVDYVTFSGVSGDNPLGLSFKQAVGPIVTVRDVQKLGSSDFHSFKQWTPSMGDLELF